MMTDMFKKISFWFLFAAALSSCKKDDAISSDIPTIELVSVSSNNIAEGDPLTFRIKYTDGDGDLGENNANAHNLFLTDNRVGVTYEYRIQELAPSGSSLIIRGNLDVVLNTTAITNGSNSQNVTYSIYVKDRSGNQSNTVTSSDITIHN
ncbi:MAG: hypothetical protein NTV09_00820 [Bacteroidetes bacterium]|nr:hypothetical protein [Bacteroidota bacterium]